MAIKQPVRKKLYRTMQGRMVDIDKLRAANEAVQAVGNMNVNARGDVIGQGGRIVKTKDAVMKDYYQTPKGVAQDTVSREQTARSQGTTAGDESHGETDPGKTSKDCQHIQA